MATFMSPERSLTLERAKTIYRAAVDSQASDGNGAAWWTEVHTEMAKVLTAPSTTEAAQVIAWWHHDWTTVGDSAKAVAQRIRAAARAGTQTTNASP